MREVQGRLAEQGLTVHLTDAARDWLADKGFDVNFGARPLRRTLQRDVESPLAVRLLHGEFQKGDEVLIDVADDGLTFLRQSSVVVPQEVSV
jgi:ATP-dependent Clp protease ATP-binding subunit ClpA